MTTANQSDNYWLKWLKYYYKSEAFFGKLYLTRNKGRITYVEEKKQISKPRIGRLYDDAVDCLWRRRAGDSGGK